MRLVTKKKNVTANQAPLMQKTEGNVTTVVIRMNNDAEMVIRREFQKGDNGNSCVETPYTRSEYEAKFGALSL